MSDKLQLFLGYVELQAGCPYVWGGKGEALWTKSGLHRHTFGGNVFDCSGLVTRGLKEAGGPDWRLMRGADSMWNGTKRSDSPGWMYEPLERTTTPLAGDLVFYGGPNKSTHVEVVMPDGRYFGAIGGDQHTVVPNALKARVRYRNTPRKDLLGFAVNPLRRKDP